MRALEPIYAALFALAKAAGASDGATPFMASRRWIAWDQMAPENSPALYQLQGPVRVELGARGVAVFRLSVEWYLYFSTNEGDLQTVNSTVLNNYLTALINAVWPLGGVKQTLGNLASDVSIDGEVVIDEGVISPPAIIRVPITILTGF